MATQKNLKDRQWRRTTTAKQYEAYMLGCSRGNPWTFRDVWDIVRTHKSHTLFLRETKMNANQVERWRMRLHFAHYFFLLKRWDGVVIFPFFRGTDWMLGCALLINAN